MKQKCWDHISYTKQYAMAAFVTDIHAGFSVQYACGYVMLVGNNSFLFVMLAYDSDVYITK